MTPTDAVSNRVYNPAGLPPFQKLRRLLMPKLAGAVDGGFAAVVLEAGRGAMLDERLDCRVRVINASRPVTVRCSREGCAARIVAAVQVRVGLKQQRANGRCPWPAGQTIAADPSS